MRVRDLLPDVLPDVLPVLRVNPPPPTGRAREMWYIHRLQETADETRDLDIIIDVDVEFTDRQEDLVAGTERHMYTWFEGRELIEPDWKVTIENVRGFHLPASERRISNIFGADYFITMYDHDNRHPGNTVAGGNVYVKGTVGGDPNATAITDITFTLQVFISRTAEAEMDPERQNEVSKDEFRRITRLHYPGLTGYAYRADIISIDDGQQFMDEIIYSADWIEEDREGHYILHMPPGGPYGMAPEYILDWTDSDDFPQPSSEPFPGEEDIEEEARPLMREPERWLAQIIDSGVEILIPTGHQGLTDPDDRLWEAEEPTAAGVVRATTGPTGDVIVWVRLRPTQQEVKLGFVNANDALTFVRRQAVAQTADITARALDMAEDERREPQVGDMVTVRPGHGIRFTPAGGDYIAIMPLVGRVLDVTEISYRLAMEGERGQAIVTRDAVVAGNQVEELITPEGQAYFDLATLWRDTLHVGPTFTIEVDSMYGGTQEGAVALATSYIEVALNADGLLPTGGHAVLRGWDWPPGGQAVPQHPGNVLVRGAGDAYEAHGWGLGGFIYDIVGEGQHIEKVILNISSASGGLMTSPREPEAEETVEAATSVVIEEERPTYATNAWVQVGGDVGAAQYGCILGLYETDPIVNITLVGIETLDEAISDREVRDYLETRGLDTGSYIINRGGWDLEQLDEKLDWALREAGMSGEPAESIRQLSEVNRRFFVAVELMTYGEGVDSDPGTHLTFGDAVRAAVGDAPVDFWSEQDMDYDPWAQTRLELLQEQEPLEIRNLRRAMESEESYELHDIFTDLQGADIGRIADENVTEIATRERWLGEGWHVVISGTSIDPETEDETGDFNVDFIIRDVNGNTVARGNGNGAIQGGELMDLDIRINEVEGVTPRPPPRPARAAPARREAPTEWAVGLREEPIVPIETPYTEFPASDADAKQRMRRLVGSYWTLDIGEPGERAPLDDTVALAATMASLVNMLYKLQLKAMGINWTIDIVPSEGTVRHERLPTGGEATTIYKAPFKVLDDRLQEIASGGMYAKVEGGIVHWVTARLDGMA